MKPIYKMNQPQRCGNCVNHARFGYGSEYMCVNALSENYGYITDYDGTCDEHEEREDNKFKEETT